MAPSRPMRLVVTRPEPQAGQWVRALQAHGWNALALPLIDIGPAPDLSSLRRARDTLATHRAVMFVSAAAVAGFFESDHALARMEWASLAPETRAWATGPGTADALRAHGVPAGAIDQPAADAPQHDSEALWQQVQPQLRAGDSVLFVRGADAGDGAEGRDWLARQVEAAGAHAQVVIAYVRRMPAWRPEQCDAARAAAVQGAWWLFSSSQAVAHLQRLVPGQDWSHARALATHPRIAAAVRDAGFGAVHTCGAGLPAVVDFLQSHR